MSCAIEHAWSMWVKPLLRHKPTNVNEEDFLRFIFAVDTRVISFYQAERGFELPGLYMVDDVRPTQGMGDAYRRLNRGEQIMARVDDTAPGTVDVCNLNKVFRLTHDEWKKTRENLRLKKGSEEL